MAGIKNTDDFTAGADLVPSGWLPECWHNPFTRALGLPPELAELDNVQLVSLEAGLTAAEAVTLLTDHRQFRDLDPAAHRRGERGLRTDSGPYPAHRERKKESAPPGQ